jgi:hypothetical protein
MTMPTTPVWDGAVPIETASAILNQFHLGEFYRSALDRYYLMHWTGNYFASKISMHQTLMHQDVEYIVICPDSTKLVYYFNQDQIRLSFRKPKPGRGLFPVVLIDLAYGA